MKRSADRILTTHGGLVPFPSVMPDLVEARKADDQGLVDTLVTKGVTEQLAAQQRIGIDLISDGEFHRQVIRNQGYFDRFTSITSRETKPGELVWLLQRPPESEDPDFAGFFEYIKKMGMPDHGPAPMPEYILGDAPRFICNGPLKYRGQDELQREVTRTREAIDAAGVDPATVFYSVLSPSWFAHFVFNEHYETEQEYLFALGDALNVECRAVVDAGMTLQLEDPALADLFGLMNPPVSIKEYRELQEVRIEADNRALAGIPEDRVRLHVCWGSMHYPHTRDIGLEHIIDLMLKVKAQGYAIEAASVSHELDYQVWEKVGLPDGKILIPGVISHMTSNRVEPPELVAHRILQYADIVGRENVIAGVDCGPGLRCQDDVAWAKLRSLVAGAEIASEKLWATAKAA